jgi:exodeoxyribonuclease VII small subunit
MPARKKLPENEESLSFEDALTSIEEIVESMEGDQLPLEDLVTQYEKGSVLLKHCESVLSSARKRIELITLANHEDSGQEIAQSSKSLSQSTPSQQDGVSAEPNDIRLF